MIQRLLQSLACGLFVADAEAQKPVTAQPPEASATGHWAWRPPGAPSAPTGAADPDAPFGAAGVDAWIDAALRREGIAASPRAAPAPLVRRLYLDLTGLPPPPAATAEFAADPSEAAYSRLVDSLLASPGFGERMAIHWLDIARYADTNGFDDDGRREAWPWRDWVVEAFQRDLPYDEFARDQLAGDLVDGATVSQLTATAFLRHHATNLESTGQPGEYRHQYIADQVATTGTAFLGLTVGCAECHDHKLDPLSQRDYYRLYAFFQSADQRGLEQVERSAPPYLRLPSAEQGAQALRIAELLGCVRTEQARLAAAERAEAAAWIAGLAERPPGDGAAGDPPADAPDAPALALALDGGGGTLRGLGTGEWVDDSHVDGALRGGALRLDGHDQYLDCGNAAALSLDRPFTLSIWVARDAPRDPARSQTVLERFEGERGYAIDLVRDRLLFFLDTDDGPPVRRTARAAIPLGEWHHLAVTYDGSRRRDGFCLYIDGRAQRTEAFVDPDGAPAAAVPATAPPVIVEGDLPQNALTRLGGIDGTPFAGRLDELRVFDRCLSEAEIAAWTRADLGDVARRQPHHPVLRRHFATRVSPAQSALHERGLDLIAAQRDLDDEIPRLSTMRELLDPPPTHVLVRGAFDQKGDVVTPGVPAFLPAMPRGAPRTRLGLAQWLTDPRHPLFARVAVNRFWRILMGRGLVADEGDWGLAGEPPTHPELLDGLAREFAGGGFRVKALVRTIVHSEAYRRASHGSPEAWARDPENLWFGRGGRWRLEAELVRDQYLALGEMLDLRRGGPPDWPQGETAAPAGIGSARRSIYLPVVRQQPRAALQVFDAPVREACTVRRDRTTSPLQSLAVLNDPLVAAAARGLARRMAGGAPAEVAARGFALATGRPPTADESAILLRLFWTQRHRFHCEPAAAQALLADSASTDPDAAAWVAVAGAILGLDEVITRS